MGLPGTSLRHPLGIVPAEGQYRRLAPGDLVSQASRDDRTGRPDGRRIADRVSRGGVVLHRRAQARLGDAVDPDQELERRLGRVEPVEPALDLKGRTAVSIGRNSQLGCALLERFSGLGILPDVPADLKLDLVSGTLASHPPSSRMIWKVSIW